MIFPYVIGAMAVYKESYFEGINNLEIKKISDIQF